MAKRGRANVRGHASDTTDFYPPAEEVRLHTLKALIKAGPGSTHCAMIDHLVSSSKLTKYVQVRKLNMKFFCLRKKVRGTIFVKQIKKKFQGKEVNDHSLLTAIHCSQPISRKRS